MSLLTKKKTYTDLALIPLTEPDRTLHDAKLNIDAQSNDFKGFLDGFFMWKHDYRQRYDKDFLKKMGYEPVDFNSRITIKEQELADYVETVDSDFKSYIRAEAGLPPIDVQLKYYYDKLKESL